MADDIGGGAVGGIAEAGVGFATGNPFAAISGVAALFGLGMSAYGTEEEVKSAQGEAQTSQNIAQLQIQENQVRQQVMETAGRRQSIEVARQTQLASAKALAGATAGGAAFSSGLAGGQAQVASEGAFQQQGISQNLASGEKMFGLDTSIDQQKIQMAQYQSQLASAQGTQAIGQGIFGAGMNFLKMFSG